MTDSRPLEVPPTGAAPPVGRLDRLLLDAKLSIPQQRQGAVSRASLIEQVRPSGCRVVGVTAPAGYGKSTLLAEWARVEARRVAWVALDRFDDDPGALLTVLASAYARLLSDDVDLVAEIAGMGVAVLGRAAPRLAAALRASSVPFVLMLDDVHELRSPDCHDVLSVVVSGIPPGSQLVASSRFEQPYLARLRASGDVLEILAGDLALDADQARQVFSSTRVSLTAEAAAEVTARTEGWPVGLYLAALIARDGSGDPTAITGVDRYVSDYLYREALGRQSEGLQRFLRRTAVLDQMSAPLCDALLDESGSQRWLGDIESAGLFLMPLDRRREWFRYHALFREFLLGELGRVEPDVVTKLHLRAADWYEGNGSPALALEHLLKTTERDRCVQLVTQLVNVFVQLGQISTVQRWLATLGDPAIEGYPPLAVLATWILVYTGHTVGAERWAEFIEDAEFDQVPADGSASFASARAMVQGMMCRVGPEQMVRDTSFALSQEPASSPWRDAALLLCAEASLLVGDDDRATTLFSEASSVALAMTNTECFILGESELAALAMDRGRWVEAAGHADRALAAVDDHQMPDYPTCIPAFIAAARLHLHRGDTAAARAELTRAMRARPMCTYHIPWLAVRVRLQLAKVYWVLGEQTTAQHLLREIDDILSHRTALGVLVDQVAAFRGIVTAGAGVQTAGGPPLSPAELRLLPYLQTHLTIREIGERLFVSRNTVNTEIGSIYRKLGVSSRGEAVEQATAVGLLGG